MTRIVADTLSGIPVDEAKSMGIAYLPQIINFGNKSYRDDCEIDTKTFLKMLMASDELPQTAAPPPNLYLPIYQELINNGESIVVVCPSTELSGTFRSATVAAQDFKDADIRIIDTKQLGGGLAATVLEAFTLAKAGKSAAEIETYILDFIQREKNYFVVDTLEYLHKGGRIGGAQALFGGLLQVKPILGIRSGRVEAIESQRTSRRALARLEELVYSDCPRDNGSHLCVMHGNAEEKANEVASIFSNELGLSNIPVYELPPAFLVHSGPGVIGASYFTN